MALTELRAKLKDRRGSVYVVQLHIPLRVYPMVHIGEDHQMTAALYIPHCPANFESHKPSSYCSISYFMQAPRAAEDRW